MALDKEKVEEILKVDLFKELGIEDMPADQKIALAEQMFDVLLKSIMVGVLENLTPEKRDELSNLFDSAGENPQAVTDFLEREVPDYEDIAKEEIAKYKKFLVSNMEK